MKESDNYFWPYKRRTSIVSAIVILLGLLTTVAILKKTINWPSEQSDTTILIGVLIFSLLPVLLALLDVFIERGGVIEVKGVKIDLSQVSKGKMKDMPIPVNIDVRGSLVNDSRPIEIYDTLRKATTCDVAIIDLKEGHAWWETRLLVLLAGAERLGKPEKVVFVGTKGGVKKCFLGWSHPYELLPLLLNEHPQYAISYQNALAASRQWALVESGPNYPIPAQAPFPQSGLAADFSNMAFDYETGKPNDLLAEQLLATDLVNKVENQETPKKISITRLNELFDAFLYTKSIDESQSPEEQLNAFFNNGADYMAITNNEQYSTMVSRLTVLNTILKTMVEQKQQA